MTLHNQCHRNGNALIRNIIHFRGGHKLSLNKEWKYQLPPKIFLNKYSQTNSTYSFLCINNINKDKHHIGKEIKKKKVEKRNGNIINKLLWIYLQRQLIKQKSLIDFWSPIVRKIFEDMKSKSKIGLRKFSTKQNHSIYEHFYEDFGLSPNMFCFNCFALIVRCDYRWTTELSLILSIF